MADRTVFRCPQCNDHNLIAKPITIHDSRKEPRVTVPGEWMLACRNGHKYVGTPGEAIQITGESR